MTDALFRRRGRTLVGMIHLPPLPGSPRHDGQELLSIERNAVQDATVLADAGFDAVLIQNTGDGPPGKDADMAAVAQMAAIGRSVAAAVPLPMGVNVLKNGIESALAIALAVGAVFVRIKVYVGAVVGAEGLVEGRAQDALAERRRLGLEQVQLLADTLDRTSRALADVPLTELSDWAVRHGHADGLVVTGRSVEETVAMLADLRSAHADTPLLVGGGATPDNAPELLRDADGIIVGTALKDVPDYGAPLSQRRAREFVAAARQTADTAR